MHLMDEHIIEIADPETGRQLGPGEAGEVVVTALHNRHWGLIRFGTGDLSSYIAEPCPCGRTASRLTGLAGRIGDAVKIRGMFVVGKQADEAIQETGAQPHGVEHLVIVEVLSMTGPAGVPERAHRHGLSVHPGHLQPAPEE